MHPTAISRAPASLVHITSHTRFVGPRLLVHDELTPTHLSPPFCCAMSYDHARQEARPSSSSTPHTTAMFPGGIAHAASVSMPHPSQNVASSSSQTQPAPRRSNIHDLLNEPDSQM